MCFMREIKFRAWDNATKSLIQPEDKSIYLYLNGSLSQNQVWCTNDLILLQYTGLKDKNGKEIYEGDVVKSGNYKGTVKWLGYNKSNTWIGCYVIEIDHNDCVSLSGSTDLKVIGNIYEK